MILFKIIKYQLYLLQLENYELGRYFRLLFKKGVWPKKDQRKNIVWTQKAIAVFLVGLIFYIACIILSFLYLHGRLFGLDISLLIVLIPFYFIFFTIATIILYPVDWMTKEIIVRRAKSKILNLQSKIKIIGIAGSYGKTTMKEVLRQILDIRYKILATPDSVNTPVGIARWILNSVTSETQILIVEMGEHYKGDIEAIGKIVKLDFGVVTGINQSHMERMGTLDNIAATIFEITKCLKAQAQIFLNADDNEVMKNYPVFVRPGKKVNSFSVRNFNGSKFDSEKLFWSAKNDLLGEIQIHLLGNYALGDVDAVAQIGKILGMAPAEIRRGILGMKPVSHRLQPIAGKSGVLIIDDAYNGNPAGVTEAVNVLSRFPGRRKIFITPGLVEMGEDSPEIHRQIGRQLSLVVDILVLIRNSVTGYIAEGFSQDSKIIWFDTAGQAHESLGTFLKPGDVVLFQNDWGDQYI